MTIKISSLWNHQSKRFVLYWFYRKVNINTTGDWDSLISFFLLSELSNVCFSSQLDENICMADKSRRKLNWIWRSLIKIFNWRRLSNKIFWKKGKKFFVKNGKFRESRIIFVRLPACTEMLCKRFRLMRVCKRAINSRCCVQLIC